jgi:hypothetical protein
MLPTEYRYHDQENKLDFHLFGTAPSIPLRGVREASAILDSSFG